MQKPALVTEHLELYYGDFHALKDVSLSIPEKKITAIIGPSGCGKSTLLRTFNRMNDSAEGIRMEGKVHFHGMNVLDPTLDLVLLRKHVGMVFQRPNPFPLSVWENILLGVKVHRLASKQDYPRIVEESLKSVLLWDDLKDKLDRSALSLTLEQQQRLCIARLLPIQPEVLLMDEPASALDPISTAHIEELIHELKNNYTIVIVTHNMQQAGRVSDHTAFFLLGELVEFDETSKIFTTPKDKRTEDYITGRFG